MTTVEKDSKPLIIDADSHLIEPPDLWTSRVSDKFADACPRVERHPVTKASHWRIGDHWLWPVGHWGHAGYSQYAPTQPREMEEMDPAAYDAKVRLERMDQYGIDQEILYPNIVGFEAPVLRDQLGGEAAIECIKVYNDYSLEWTQADPARLTSIAMLPYWSREASVAEMRRCIEKGHRGVLFANKFERIGLPNFCDEYWDPVYAVAQELKIPVNYHVGFTGELVDYVTPEKIFERRGGGRQARLDRALAHASGGQKHLEAGRIITSGICDRFPELKFVSVESGFGYIPYYLECLDWEWQAGGALTPGELLPSEYFRRQCYGSLWFETTTLPLLELYPDNFMFSTDFPHPTSLSPGPASPAKVPSEHVEKYYGDLKPETRRKVLSGNAQTLYGI
ncbi:amidohydrolase family protein [Pseudofrankia asymbiotica]|uniref:Amidohydrolase-related domain-containing protein n=1 Tax=Pseudofrankia asymbiotica TaxID=1834516 RepID=A0A1V2I5T0_9ACTN|nr:amidohydrolase family protein [Pseudofrankia asymbiotica]ONH26416.1 hypothetical protein BL253_24860 [Pseudofrankia asymbiotica]